MKYKGLCLAMNLKYLSWTFCGRSQPSSEGDECDLLLTYCTSGNLVHQSTCPGAVRGNGPEGTLGAGPRVPFQAHSSLIRSAFLSAGDIIYPLIYLFKECAPCPFLVLLDRRRPPLNMTEGSLSSCTFRLPSAPATRSDSAAGCSVARC